VLGDIVNPYHSSGMRLMEAVGFGVSKAAALADLAAQRDVTPVEVVAFGDMPNDLPMLAYAGTSYAVCDAHPEVLAAVRHVIGGPDKDGVAVVLEQLFPTRA
jgi:hydroxymethylpyrimidine pyrophosphatase-like HAD family hydrolase